MIVVAVDQETFEVTDAGNHSCVQDAQSIYGSKQKLIGFDNEQEVAEFKENLRIASVLFKHADYQ